MTARRFVHEKTLELNLSAEVLSRVRQRFPNAFLIGMTQERENRNGVDSAIQSVRRFLGAIQFKAAYRPRYPGDYRFSFSSKQLFHLRNLAKRFPGRVSYYLPMVNSRDDLRLGSPSFLTRTARIRAQDVPSGSHGAWIDPPRVIIHSELIEEPLVTAAEELELWLESAHVEDNDRVNAPSDAAEIIRWLSTVDTEPGRVAGQALRGLALLAVPDTEPDR